MSLTGQTAWVVGGVGVVGRGIARGLLKAGATVIVNSRSAERLERITDDLQEPERLIAIHGSLLPDQGAEQTVQDTLSRVGNGLNHVVAHGAVRYWTQKRGVCDETYSLAPPKNNVLDLSPEEFRMQSSQLASLHFSAAKNLLPRLGENSSYTFVTGDGSGHPSTRRSPMGDINSHHVWGFSAALRRQMMDNNSDKDKLAAICRELRIGLAVNRSEEERAAEPRPRPLSEDIGDLCAGLAAATNDEKEQGKFIRIATAKGLDDLLIEYHVDADKDIGPLPSFAEFVGSL